jgi:uncharacterized protein YjiK
MTLPRIRTLARPSLAALTVLSAGLVPRGAPRAWSDSVLARYDLEAPPGDRWELPRALDEISGLAIDADGRVFAHQDERAIIFELEPSTHRVARQFTFGSPAIPGDFEAIALVGDSVVLVTSDGVLYVGARGRDGAAVPFVTYATGVGRSCEVEGLAYEPGDRSLLLACKVPRDAFTRGHVTIFRWSLDRRRLVEPAPLHIPVARLAHPIGASDFRPSDLTRDPRTGRFLLLAARERAIAELTPDGQVERVVRLQRKLHRQPEGIAITPDGALLVSDEAARGHATLSVYTRDR